MEVFVSPVTDPLLNMGLEAYFLERFEGEGCLVYRNVSSVVIGKNQNPYREVDVRLCKENNIPVLRRISGGGAVYHDLGNINTAVFGKRLGIGDDLYARWTEPPIRFLESLGIDAVRDGRNGLEVAGRKISGSAQALKKERFLHHATLLVSSDLGLLEGSLSPQEVLIDGQGVKSHRSPVANLGEFLPRHLTTEDFMDDWVRFLCGSMDEAKRSNIPNAAGEFAQRQIEKQFGNWSWNIGRCPRFKYRMPIEGNTLVFVVYRGVIESMSWDSDSNELPSFLEGKAFSLETLMETDLKLLCPDLENLLF
jgi:lipoate-protein ligase A